MHTHHASRITHHASRITHHASHASYTCRFNAYLNFWFARWTWNIPLINSAPVPPCGARIDSPGGEGQWGSWSDWSYCPDGSYASGIRTRVERDQGWGDNTAFNAARLK